MDVGALSSEELSRGLRPCKTTKDLTHGIPEVGRGCQIDLPSRVSACPDICVMAHEFD